MATAKPLPLGNDYLIRVYLQEFDADTNEYVPATALSDVEAYFSSDPSGADAIYGLDGYILSELSVSADPDNAGWYTVTVDAADLSALNTTQYLGQVIYRVLTIGSPVQATQIQPLRVVRAVA